MSTHESFSASQVLEVGVVEGSEPVRRCARSLIVVAASGTGRAGIGVCVGVQDAAHVRDPELYRWAVVGFGGHVARWTRSTTETGEERGDLVVADVLVDVSAKSCEFAGEAVLGEPADGPVGSAGSLRDRGDHRRQHIGAVATEGVGCAALQSDLAHPRRGGSAVPESDTKLCGSHVQCGPVAHPWSQKNTGHDMTGEMEVMEMLLDRGFAIGLRGDPGQVGQIAVAGVASGGYMRSGQPPSGERRRLARAVLHGRGLAYWSRAASCSANCSTASPAWTLIVPPVL